MEASALPTRFNRGRAPLSVAFLRVRSDEQLVALFRAGSDDAFRAIHDRYRARLLAYARQMLHGAISDPEDALQDVFVRAYRALRASDRPVLLRAWLYRIAHNRCIDELRRPCPVPSELAADAEPAFTAPAASHEPAAVAERSATLARLVADVQKLPEQQRSALLMRELQGLSYEELGAALDVSLPAVKSLLLRARTGLVDLAIARDTPCIEIRDELLAAADRSVRISGRARRHCAECTSCDAYKGELKRVRRSFAALTPAGPLGHLAMLFGVGGGGAAAAGGGGAAAGGGALAGVTATKIAVAVCCAALITTAGRAVIAPSAPSAPPAPPAHAARVQAPAPLARRASAAAAGSSATPTHARPPSHGAKPARPGAATGTTGTTGTTSDGGASGPAGPTAASGPTGASGVTGDTGASGSSGATGASSPAGATPPVAVNGIGGASAGASDGYGANSPTGATGATGTTGASGASGTTGATSSPSGVPDSATGSSGPTAVAAGAAGTSAGG